MLIIKNSILPFTTPMEIKYGKSKSLVILALNVSLLTKGHAIYTHKLQYEIRLKNNFKFFVFIPIMFCCRYIVNPDVLLLGLLEEC